jgi:putative endopeptidase
VVEEESDSQRPGRLGCRFFIGLAQWASGDVRPEHSPLEFRINGVVPNTPEFRAAFSCTAGQPMVRQNVCRVW